MSSYLLIAYKPSSNDYCRGCHMASYSSNLEKTVCDSLSDLIDQYVHYTCQKLSINEEPYEIEVLDTNFEEVYLDDLGINDAIIARIEEVRQEREALAKEREREIKEAADAAERERELKMLGSLKEKYEGTARIASPHYRDGKSY